MFSLKAGDLQPKGGPGDELNVVALSGHFLALQVFDPRGTELPRVEILDLNEQKVIWKIQNVSDLDYKEASETGFTVWTTTGLKVTRENCPDHADQAQDEDNATGVPIIVRKVIFDFATLMATETPETMCLLDVD